MTEDFFVKTVRQIIPSSGLWLRRRVKNPADASLPVFAGSAEFQPVVAIALVELEGPPSAHFTDCGLMPLSPDDLLYGLIERTPYLGLRVAFTVYHDSDFLVLGEQLKSDAKPRSVHGIGGAGRLETERAAAPSRRAARKSKS